MAGIPDDDELALSSGERELVRTARTFAREVLAPAAASWEQERTLPRAAVTEAARLGLAGLLAPAEVGGGEVGPVGKPGVPG